MTQSTKKTDTRDAFTIAKFLLKKMFPEIYLSDQETEVFRKFICKRLDLVSLLVITKNRIHT
ncbi:MAG: IS110 family transposase [Pleomorphochaeta sp.]